MRRSLSVLIGLFLAAVAIALGARYLEQAVEEARRTEAMREFADEIYRSRSSLVAGNPQGDVTVVAFLDYNCPDCRADTPELAKLIANDGNVRLVVKELPVMGKNSDVLARLALAAAKQGKYLKLHEKFFTTPGPLTREQALVLADGLGLDRAQLVQDSRDRVVAKALADNKRIAGKLGVKDVPFYLVGDRVLGEGSGDLYEQLSESVADIRAHGCQVKC